MKVRSATQAEKEEAKARIDKATDHELGQLYMHLVKYDPFEKYKPLLPSAIRAQVRKNLKTAIDKGLLNPIKDER